MSNKVFGLQRLQAVEQNRQRTRRRFAALVSDVIITSGEDPDIALIAKAVKKSGLPSA